ncbi:MAG TPA: helix-turn-helix domain-containing protein [Chitinophagales bacterium]|nr:helix-turn-helix domain-containing protein [Chitinophagales bacterium]HRK25892.1 helix-turn-helix domain-containing protein [Chitinophagales bacterium]
MQKHFSKHHTTCPFNQTLEVLGGKWKFAIIKALLDNEVLRFKELERTVEGITARMLVKELKHLEEHGIITRTAYATVPPTVEYRLTDCGKTLENIITELHRWGELHIAQLKTKRK